MRFLSFIFVPTFALANPRPEKRATCQADNCARAVTGRAANVSPPLTIRRADCSSFFAVVVTPITTSTITQYTATSTILSTSTTTETAQITGISTIQANKRREDNIAAIASFPHAIPTYASACSNLARYSSACSCFGILGSTSTAPISTSTVTVQTDATTLIQTTVTSTVAQTVTTAVVTATSTCDNAGMQWAFYQEYYAPYVDPTVMKVIPPDIVSVTSQAHVNTSYDGDADDKAIIYGKPVNPGYLYVLQQRGYLFATESGTYTFSATGVNYYFYLWFGSQAYSGWTKTNAQIRTTYDKSTSTPGSGHYSITLLAGTYVPFRIAFAQLLGPGSFDFTVTTPSGVQIISPTSNYSISVVQYSCDGVSAPAFQVFSKET